MALQVRRGTQADLIASNLLLGEPAYAIDTKRFLIGSGDSNPLLVVTQDSGSWTPVLTDFNGNPQPTTSISAQWRKTGNVVTVFIEVVCGSGATGNLRLTGMPPAIRPSSARYISGMLGPGAGSPNKMLIGGGVGTAGTIYLQRDGGGYLNGADTASGDRIILSGSYIL